MKMPRKITNRIVVYYALLVLALVAFLLFFFMDLMRKTHLGLIRQDIGEKIKIFELMMKGSISSGQGRNSAALNKAVIDYTGITGLRITLIASDGTVVAESNVEELSEMDNHLYRKEVSDAFGHGEGESIRYSNTIKTDMLYMARKSGSMVIRLARPLREIEENEVRTRKMILFSGLLAIVISVSIVYVISRRITGPIRETIRFARSFSEGDYSRRVLNYEDDEVGALQRSLNKLADNLVEKIHGLELEEKKLKVTIDNINDGIAVIDTNKRILLANRALASLLHIGADVLNRFYYEVIRSSALNAKIEYAILKKEKSLFVDELHSGLICEVYIIPIKEEGTLQGVLLVLHDITERKKIDRLKTELVGNLSHELKTPLTIQRGYLETMIEHAGDPARCREFIDKALANVDRQNSIISDMLKLNLLETSIHFPRENIDLGEVLMNCLELLNLKISGKSIEVVRKLDKPMNRIDGNRFLAEEVFFNIIDNAINYNMPGGKIILETAESMKNLTISVTDTGIGIPVESIGRIFERFYRVDKSRSRATGGTGLGLSIVKHAVEILGWQISVASSRSGTTFTILVPLTPV